MDLIIPEKNTRFTSSLRDICDVHTPLRGAISMFGSGFWQIDFRHKEEGTNSRNMHMKVFFVGHIQIKNYK